MDYNRAKIKVLQGPRPAQPKIAAVPGYQPCPTQVIGVGGGGSNAVNRMLQSDLTGVDFWVVNTDVQVQAGCSQQAQTSRV